MGAARRCVGCPRLVSASAYRGRCKRCLARYDEQRGTPAERGYDAEYQAIRRQYQARMNAGETFLCWDGCGRTVDPTRWHLGHDQDDRSIIRGPQWPSCNLSAAGRASQSR